MKKKLPLIFFPNWDAYETIEFAKVQLKFQES